MRSGTATITATSVPADALNVDLVVVKRGPSKLLISDSNNTARCCSGEQSPKFQELLRGRAPLCVLMDRN